LYNRFKKETGIEIIEGYGLTECTCLVSINPPEGVKKIGSVGLPFPYTHVRILQKTPEGFRDCEVDEVGEICVANPGVFEGSTYTEMDKNKDLFAEGRFLRTGDLGRIDADGYLWITGRAKDLIIRGGHNIDPAAVEINLDRGVLTIDGERKPSLPAGDEKTTLHLNERFDGRFRRVVSLPDDIDPASVTADYRDGVLHVTSRYDGTVRKVRPGV
jgi:acyl-CoA synthetase (AMP-forming)/AMP-acid ligase II